MTEQIPLSIHLNTQHSLANFMWGNNQLLQQAINRLLACKEQFLYLWGESGIGKTHLLQACCQYENNQNRSAMYLPLRVLQQVEPEALEGLEQFHFVAIDDIDGVAGRNPWEESLFHLYNRIRDNGHTRLMISAQQSPSQIPIQLADLRSRLGWGLSYFIEPLGDEHKTVAIQKMALELGIVLTDQVTHYLMARCSRNMHDLIAILSQLDKASLAAKRKITLPFVKKELGL